MYRVYIREASSYTFIAAYTSHKLARRQWRSLRNGGNRAVILQPN